MDELIIDTKEFEIGSSGGEINILIKTNIEYTAEILGHASEWITIKTLKTKALEDCFLVLAIAENTSYSGKVGQVKVSGNDKESVITITQSQMDALIVTTSEYEIEAEGGEISIPISTNLDYKVEFEGDAASWIKVKELKTKSLEDCTLVIEISENSGNERIGVLNIVGENTKTAITITQRGKKSNNVIYYTSSDGQVITPYRSDGFGANIVSNEYINGSGIIKFDGDVTSIGDWAFNDCSKMTSVTIPESVISIGAGAFLECSNLTSVTIPDSVTSIGLVAFVFCSNLTSIYGKFASEDNRCLIVDGVLISFAPAGLTEYSIPSSAFSIGSGALCGCANLTSIKIPNSVTSIGEESFENCSSLISVEIPSSVISIGDSAFSGCTSLTSYYGKYASNDNRCLVIDGVLRFFAPAGLTSYTIPSNVTSIGKGVFSSCSNLVSIEIPNTITSIGNGAFSSCSNLASIEIPDSVTSMGNHVFRGCSSLTSVKISNSITSIGNNLFGNCTNLTTIKIPDSVTSIGEWSFYSCKSLSSFYCKPKTPPTLGTLVFFETTSNLKIYVPNPSVDAYIAATNWSDYANKIVGYNF